jgi:hypothetical protein
MKSFRPFSIAVVLLAVCAILVPGAEHAYSLERKMLQGAHASKSIMPKNCRSCHMGMTMALSGEEGSCLSCHGGPTGQGEMVKRGLLQNPDEVRLLDIEAELRKPYNHPVLSVQGVHRQFELLPENMVNATRHSECVDCHDPHVVEKNRPFRGIAGRRVGNFIADVEHEYELCYKCHSESANLPGNYTNKHAEFRISNPSYHPVEAEGRNTNVISLLEPYVAQKESPGDISMITCSDCHGSDDPNGPRGPHGSVFPGLLSRNYQTSDEVPESEYAYALCYKCHDRRSILSNESFPYHALHIQGGVMGGSGTSCFTCHDAHGSTRYTNLIRFDETIVSPNQDEKLEFKAEGYTARHGACLLNCHGVEHNPKEY